MVRIGNYFDNAIRFLFKQNGYDRLLLLIKATDMGFSQIQSQNIKLLR